MHFRTLVRGLYSSMRRDTWTGSPRSVMITGPSRATFFREIDALVEFAICNGGRHRRNSSPIVSTSVRDDSSDDGVKDFTADVGETEISPAVAVGQFGVVDAHQIENGGVDVVHVDRLFDGLEAEVVGGSVDGAALDRSAGEPHGEAEWIVISTLLDLAATAAHFTDRGAAEFGAAND